MDWRAGSSTGEGHPSIVDVNIKGSLIDSEAPVADG